ncbi:hypothetical protein ACFQ07_34345 [Actinomadura adrarensis]|uniref:Uncharacterized protein n=1 Tax=Actinomadura adrarensis TaxID=1819600 RepID=A0ABW3CSZ5_9ACTN
MLTMLFKQHKLAAHGCAPRAWTCQRCPGWYDADARTHIKDRLVEEARGWRDAGVCSFEEVS